MVEVKWFGLNDFGCRDGWEARGVGLGIDFGCFAIPGQLLNLLVHLHDGPMEALLVGWSVLNGFFSLGLLSEFLAFSFSIGAGDGASIRASGMAWPVGPALGLAVIVVVFNRSVGLRETSRAPAFTITGWGARTVIVLSARPTISVGDESVGTLGVSVKATSEDVGILFDEFVGCFEGVESYSH